VPNDDGELSQMTKENLSKFANNLNGDLKVSCGIRDLSGFSDHVVRD
jgi:hypothetical protein